MDDTIEYGDAILLRYRLATQDGELLEDAFEGEPLALTLGEGTLATGLESRLRGLSPGRRYTFLLAPEEAFGMPDADNIHHLPLATFPPETPPRAGMLMEFSLPEGDSRMGIVIEVTGEHAVVDFNHPLSGCALTFEVEVSKAG